MKRKEERGEGGRERRKRVNEKLVEEDRRGGEGGIGITRGGSGEERINRKGRGRGRIRVRMRDGGVVGEEREEGGEREEETRSEGRRFKRGVIMQRQRCV